MHTAAHLSIYSPIHKCWIPLRICLFSYTCYSNLFMCIELLQVCIAILGESVRACDSTIKIAYLLWMLNLICTVDDETWIAVLLW